MPRYATDLEAIREAAVRIEGVAHRTPVVTCETIDRLAGRRLLFKCENLQRVGAFKIRGATNAIFRLTDEAAAPGVVTHSSGNHAQAVAYAAARRGIAAHIVMPSNAPGVKRRAVEGYGARVIECEPTIVARGDGAAAVLKETGGAMIPPFDHPDVIAGQGTTGLELHGQAGDAGESAPGWVPGNLDAVVAPVGGGGLLSGVTLAFRELSPSTRVIAAEPRGADDAARSKAAGRLVPQTGPDTIADGLLTSLGEHTWPVVRDLVDRVVTVTDEEIVRAMRLLWERAKLVVEPSGAVPLAAVLSDEFRALPGMPRVGVILSGGNVDLDHLPW